jgi:glyoxylase-like metal-dependent hydrolase (beta-lactamase superfamily II)
LGPFEFFHVPGHCAGHVVIRLQDVLFSGDHILSEISPHQSPESITPSTGLTHYFQSLESIRLISNQVRLTLPGHQNPILDLGLRLEAILETHKVRLTQVLDYLGEPRTIQELSQLLFGEVHGYNVLLALEETGAHVEYLYQRGLLGLTNLREIENSDTPLPIRYRCIKPRSESIQTVLKD